MPEISASNSITAKVRAKFGARLTPQNYHDMLTLGSVAEVAAYLKTRTRYAQALSDVRESAIHRGNLERRLNEQYLRDISGLCRFERSVGDKMAAVVMRREEMRVILEFLRYLASGHPEDYMLISSGISDRIVSFSIEKMASARTLGELAAALGTSPFAKTVDGFAKRGNGIDYTSIEAAIHAEMFRFEREFIIDNFNGDTRRDLLTLLNMKAELQNARLCYRAKKYYRSSKEIIMSRMLDASCYINQDKRRRMADADSSDDVLAHLRETRYGEYMKSTPHSSPSEFCARVMFKKYLNLLRMSSSPAVVSVCYTELTEIEIRNIVTIIEGVRYNASPDSIEKLIITE